MTKLSDEQKAALFHKLEAMDGRRASSRQAILKPPFSYPGSKLKSVSMIRDILPYRKKYCEPFGGTGVVLLNRRPSSFEVFNDRYSGITDFYKCLHNKIWLQLLMKKIGTTIHSREFFIWCQDTWENEQSIVDRAFKWYYMMRYSFGGIGRNFGRSVGEKNNDSGKIMANVPGFLDVHERLRKVMIENKDALELMKEFDSVDCVHYLDPPYLDCGESAYKFMMNKNEHRNMLDTIFQIKGYVALSGYENNLYNCYAWDEVIKWEVKRTITPMAFCDTNYKKGKEQTTRETINECLWIKR